MKSGEKKGGVKKREDYLRYALYNRGDRTVPFSSLSRNSKSRRFTRLTRGRKGTCKGKSIELSFKLAIKFNEGLLPG